MSDSISHAAEDDGLLEGQIVGGSRNLYHVETEQGIVACSIRGRLHKQLTYPLSASGRRGVQKVRVNTKDPVAVGDRVRILATGAGHGVIEAILERAGGAFTRGDPDPDLGDPDRGGLTTVAGIDQMILIFAARDPEPHLRLLDRFLVIAETQALAAAIVLNKTDLGVTARLAARLAVYAGLGYPLIHASTVTGAGLDDLRALIAGRTSALLGTSGVGKTSLLNALEPGLGLRVNAVSAALHKGRHTTTGTRLFRLAGPGGGALADTAGIRTLAVGGRADGLAQGFREFRPYLGACRHRDCAHLVEPDCAVRAAVRAGQIDAERYASYMRLAGGDVERDRELVWDADTDDAWDAGEG